MSIIAIIALHVMSRDVKRKQNSSLTYETIITSRILKLHSVSEMPERLCG